jgi:hypothetical protein
MTTNRSGAADLRGTATVGAFQPLIRLAGLLGLLAGGLQVALFFGNGFGWPEPTLVGAWNVLQLPVAIALWAWLRPRSSRVVDVATACGVSSLALWAASAAVPSLAPYEALWIGLSAAWWLGIGVAIGRERRFLAVLTVIVGIAAVGDAIVTVPEMLGRPLPELAIRAPMRPLPGDERAASAIG